MLMDNFKGPYEAFIIDFLKKTKRKPCKFLAYQQIKDEIHAYAVKALEYNLIKNVWEEESFYCINGRQKGADSWQEGWFVIF